MTIEQKINTYLLHCLKAQLYQGNICNQGSWGSLVMKNPNSSSFVMKNPNSSGCLLNKPKQCGLVVDWEQSITMYQTHCPSTKAFRSALWHMYAGGKTSDDSYDVGVSRHTAKSQQVAAATQQAAAATNTSGADVHIRSMTSATCSNGTVCN